MYMAMSPTTASVDSPQKPVFTLRELLFGIAAFSVLFAIGTPMLLAYRERSRQDACASNLKQLALACHVHHDLYKRLPPASYLVGTGGSAGLNVADLMAPIGGTGPTNGYSWIARLLPYLGEGALFTDIAAISSTEAKFTLPLASTAAPGRTLSPGQSSIDVLRCPSFIGGRFCDNGVYPRRDYALSNYAAFAATHSALVTTPSLEPNGAISNSPQRRHFGRNFGQIFDGTSRTFLLVETRESGCAAWIDGTCNWVVGHPWNTQPTLDTNGTSWNAAKITLQASGYRSNDGWVWGPSSPHASGTVNHALADGSVRGIAADTDPRAYVWMIDVNGQEPNFFD